MKKLFISLSYLSMTDAIAIGLALGTLISLPWHGEDVYTVAAVALCAIWLGISKIRMARQVTVLDEKVTTMIEMTTALNNAVNVMKDQDVDR